jgi:hypothetical protein
MCICRPGWLLLLLLLLPVDASDWLPYVCV